MEIVSFPALPLTPPLLTFPYHISFPFLLSFLLTMRSSLWLMVGGNFFLLKVVAHCLDRNSFSSNLSKGKS